MPKRKIDPSVLKDLLDNPRLGAEAKAAYLLLCVHGVGKEGVKEDFFLSRGFDQHTMHQAWLGLRTIEGVDTSGRARYKITGANPLLDKQTSFVESLQKEGEENGSE